MTDRAETTTAPRIDEEWIRTVPKAEVHVHLEGAFELIDLLELAKAAGEPLPGPARSLFDIGTHHDFRVPTITTGGAESGAGAGGLTGFLRFLDWECGLVRSPEQAARQAYAFAARQSASGIRYTDVIVNPTHWRAWRGRLGDLLDAFAAGFEEAEHDGLCVVNLCVSILRQQTSEEAAELARWIVRTEPRRVVALSVDGDERTMSRSGARFAEAFGIARDAGLGRTVHAGESSGPESVWDALRLLHAQRIDHGVRAIEDAALVAELASSGVSLGLCPRSNVSLGVTRSWAEHPFARLRDAGVTVTLNTDDPAPLGSTLVGDWALAAETFGFGRADLLALAESSVNASFASPDFKRDLLAEIRAIGTR
ncbi:adenosine deaminase [Subtercola sp. YIM 133946]|uniref:adenosine deaminase n=1 Tax=Subtercola sp. YIM 133946 TaxID=3118909 RepID=UPI002F951EAA